MPQESSVSSQYINGKIPKSNDIRFGGINYRVWRYVI